MPDSAKKKKSADGRSTGSRRSTSSSKSSSKVSKTKSIGINQRRSSISSMASTYNMTTGRYCHGDMSNSNEAVQMFRDSRHLTHYGNCLYDTVLLFLVCPNHKKMALCFVDDKGHFLPCGPIKTGDSWLSSLAALLGRLLPKPKEDQTEPLWTDPVPIDILRLQLPIYYEFLTRVTYRVKLTDAACKAKMCQDQTAMAWYTLAQFGTKVYKSGEFAGPEPMLCNTFIDAGPAHAREITILDVLLYQISGDKKLSAQGEILRNCGITDQDILLIYGDFLQHCFPSEFMTLKSFKSYLSKAKLKLSSNHDAAFRAFAFNGRDYINFHEFVIGLAIVGSISGTTSEQPSTSSMK